MSAVDVEITTVHIPSRKFKDFWTRFRRNRAAVLGLVLVGFVFFVAGFAPLLTPYEPWKIGFETNSAPNREHFFGTDDLGRDVYTRTVFGTRISLIVGILAALTSTVIGIAVGATAGYIGGRVDDILMRITELFQVIPKFFLALIIAFFFGAGVWNIILVIGILSWPSTCRLVRAEFLSLKEQEFVQAARSIGARKRTIIFSEIFPNATPPVIVNASLQVASAILIEASLSFFGLGDPSWVSWGRMLYDAQRLLRIAWWTSVFPGVAIFITVLGVNLVGDGLNDALNPRLRET